MAEYSEPLKIVAREAVIFAAIKALTTDRTDSTLARRSYVREVRDQLLTKGTPADQIQAAKLTDDDLSRWESFYDSLVHQKPPSALKVAYLSGPNPENDLRVFCASGILPENIWAFESSNATYDDAVVAAISSKFKFIKIVNGGIDAFIESTPTRFDIIYLDFCGPLPSRNKKQKTLGAITKVLARHALNSPGVLITNVALPTENQDSTGRDLLAKLAATYLYPKSFVESKNSDPGIIEGPVSHGLDPNQWLTQVRVDLDEYYGQFVTRLLIDQATYISPYERFPKKGKLFSNLFDLNNDAALASAIEELFHFDAECDGGDVIVDPGRWPIPWSLSALVSSLNSRDKNYPQWIYSDQDFAKFAELFCRQLSSSIDSKDLVKSLTTMSYLLSEGSGQEEFWSKYLRLIYDNHHPFKYHQFCDLLLFHQILELLFRQLASPYHVNVAKTQRWKYHAKSTPMYMDMLVLDECRYLYDWMPTIDMIAAGMNDVSRQLAYRFALDGVAKHCRWYNTELLSGTAVIDQFTKPFQAQSLRARTLVK